MTITQPERTYTSQEVVELTGATYRQLDYWAARGLLNETATGSGHSRNWTASDLEVVYHAVRLIRAGFTAPAAVNIAAENHSWSGTIDGQAS